MSNRNLKFIIVASLVAAAAGTLAVPAAEPAASETKEQRAERMAWWRDARFGMFIHCGPVSL